MFRISRLQDRYVIIGWIGGLPVMIAKAFCRKTDAEAYLEDRDFVYDDQGDCWYRDRHTSDYI